MSAMWSLTYLKTTLTERELFDAAVELFRLELDGRLYGLEYEGQELVSVKAGAMIVEWFDTPQRARIITNALMTERMGHGVFVYPKHNNLFTLADSVIQLGDVWSSGRTRRAELAEMLKERPDPSFESLFHYMRFLSRLTEIGSAEAAHILHERNPAGEVTGIHFYRAGQFIDDYFKAVIDDDEVENMIELPQHPDIVGKLLDKQFAFLLDQPRRWAYSDGEEEVDVYFGVEHLGRRLPEYDVFNLRDSDLYVPFWEDNMLPIGAVYCLDKELPDYFLKRYKS